MGLHIDLSFNPEKESNKAKERQVRASERKKASEETLDDAFKRILAQKNTPTDEKKLKEVFSRLKAGTLKRETSDNGKKFSKAEALRLYKQLEGIKRSEILRDMVKDTPSNYHLVLTKDSFERFLKELSEESIIALDTETTGTDVVFGRDYLVGVCISNPKANQHYYIPLRHNVPEKQLDKDYVITELRPFLENEDLKKVLHETKFDMHVLLNEGVHLKGVIHDTMVAHHIINENEEDLKLKNLATRYLKIPSHTYSELFSGGFQDVPLDIALSYAAKDSEITWKLYQLQKRYFDKYTKLKMYYEKIENPLIEVLAFMERTGFTIDDEYVSRLENELKKEINVYETVLDVYFPGVNLNSPKQLKELFYDRLGLQKHLPKGEEPSTDASTLKKLEKHHKGIETLLKYKEAKKLLSTYVENIPKKKKKDGKIHPEFGQVHTVSGRLNSSNPNFQNIDPRAREMFIAPPGHVILSGDFSSQEPRILASYTKQPSMIQAFKNGLDIYSSLAVKIFNKPYEEVGDKTPERKAVKVLLLSIMYGVSPSGVAAQLKISEKKAKEIISDFYRDHPEVKIWMTNMIDFARVNKYVEMPVGRRRRLPDINSSDFGEKMRNERQAINSLVQGMAACQTKATMIKMHELCLKKGWKMLFSIHDEIAVLAPSSITREDVKEFENVMINAMKISVPNATDIEISTRWGEGMTIDEYFDKL